MRVMRINEMDIVKTVYEGSTEDEGDPRRLPVTGNNGAHEYWRARRKGLCVLKGSVRSRKNRLL